jgi:nucleoside-diphosphate-sugar epimerase
MINTKELKNKRIYIVGGCGFIGHNLAINLVEMGATVGVLDGLEVNNNGYYLSQYSTNSNSERYLAFIAERLVRLKARDVKIDIGDARNYHLVSKMMDDFSPDIVIHLAAVAHANRSNKDPYSTFDHSLRTLENVLDNCRINNRHLIYLSSSMVYGNFDGIAVTEEHLCNPLGIYGSLKYGAEKLVIAYNQVFGLPYTIIRPSALYGERCVSRRVGQAFIENALQGLNLTINGDGNDELDFTYIEDLAQGIIRCCIFKEAINQIFNLTFGSSRSIKIVAEIITNQFPGVSIEYNPRDNLMPERGTLCIDKAKELIGYDPKFPVEKGFIKYIDWYKNLSNEKPYLFLRK